ncbi:MAG: hypothetical protein ACP5RN_13880, partial [Armatimonadota bacterium]
LMVASFLHLHRGLHLRSITKEVFDERALAVHRNMGFRLLGNPGSSHTQARRPTPLLIGADRDDMRAAPGGTFLWHLFSHQQPALHLRREQMELLQLGHLLEIEDEDICAILRMRNVQCVWLRWHRLYTAFEQADMMSRYRSRNNRRARLLQAVRRQPNVAAPLLIGRRLYNNPALARQFTIPCGGV